MSFDEIDSKGFAQALQLNRGLDSLSPVVMFGLASKKLAGQQTGISVLRQQKNGAKR
jgi:hypothetical protein